MKMIFYEKFKCQEIYLIALGYVWQNRVYRLSAVTTILLAKGYLGKKYFQANVDIAKIIDYN